MAQIDREGEHARQIVASISKATHAYEQFSRDRRAYLILMRRAFLELIGEGDLVYHGFASHFLVADQPGCLRVRVNAPLSYRLRQGLRQGGVNSEEEAREQIRRVDEERVRWARFMYGRDIRDPTLYDICFCLRDLSVEFVAALLSAAARRPELQLTPEQRRLRRASALAAAVEARLVLDPATAELQIAARAEAGAETGAIQLKGPHLKAEVLARVEQIAMRVDGVRSVTYRIGYGATFAALPGA